MNKDRREQYAIAMEDAAKALRYGCSDHYCKLVPDKPKGMGTNGGCRCLRELPNTLFAVAAAIEMESGK